MNNNEPDKLTLTIKQNFENKATEELLEIWIKNNYELYSNSAFDAIKLILEERNVPIPEQEEYIPSSNKKLISLPCTFKNNTFRTRFVQTLLILSLPLWSAAVLSGIWEYNLLNDIKYDTFETEEQMRIAANFSDMIQGLIGLGQLVFITLTFIFFMMWIHRSNNNARALTGKPMEFTPGWSVGWFFVPFANLWKPYQALKEIWQVCSNGSAGSSIVGLWWASWLISSVLSQVGIKLQIRAEEIDQLIVASTISIASDAVDVISKVFTFLLVTKIFSMQQDIEENLKCNTFGENWC